MAADVDCHRQTGHMGGLLLIGDTQAGSGPAEALRPRSPVALMAFQQLFFHAPRSRGRRWGLSSGRSRCLLRQQRPQRSNAAADADAQLRRVGRGSAPACSHGVQNKLFDALLPHRLGLAAWQGGSCFRCPNALGGDGDFAAAARAPDARSGQAGVLSPVLTRLQGVSGDGFAAGMLFHSRWRTPSLTASVKGIAVDVGVLAQLR